MRVSRLWLHDFRSYDQLELTLPEGLTAIVGRNGQGKTNVLEAIGWLATMRSFRGATTDALVREHAERAIVRAEVCEADRTVHIDAEIARNDRNRVLVNHQRLARSRDLLGALRVTVFAPDDLALVKGAPSMRREWLDDVLSGLALRNDRLRTDYDRVLRQRNALLKQAAGRLSPDVATTLDVWDAKLAQLGDQLGVQRAELVDALAEPIAHAYAHIADSEHAGHVTVTYEAQWRTRGLATELDAARRDDLRRATTTVGPHRDDLGLAIDTMAARTHRSQGEQRSLALALRLAAHRYTEQSTGSTPVLLLDDVFSELDVRRARALLSELPSVQTLLTSAVGVPPGVRADLVIEVADHRAVQRF